MTNSMPHLINLFIQHLHIFSPPSGLLEHFSLLLHLSLIPLYLTSNNLSRHLHPYTIQLIFLLQLLTLPSMLLSNLCQQLLTQKLLSCPFSTLLYRCCIMGKRGVSVIGGVNVGAFIIFGLPTSPLPFLTYLILQNLRMLLSHSLH